MLNSFFFSNFPDNCAFERSSWLSNCLRIAIIGSLCESKHNSCKSRAQFRAIPEGYTNIYNIRKYYKRGKNFLPNFSDTFLQSKGKTYKICKLKKKQSTAHKMIILLVTVGFSFSC